MEVLCGRKICTVLKLSICFALVPGGRLQNPVYLHAAWYPVTTRSQPYADLTINPLSPYDASEERLNFVKPSGFQMKIFMEHF